MNKKVPEKNNQTVPQPTNDQQINEDNVSINKGGGDTGVNSKSREIGEGSFINQDYNVESSDTAINKPERDQVSPKDRIEHVEKIGDDANLIPKEMTNGIDDEGGLVDTIIEVNKPGDLSPRQADCMKDTKGITNIHYRCRQEVVRENLLVLINDR